MVGIPRLALVAIVGALPFAGALLADEARGDGPDPAEHVRFGDDGAHASPHQQIVTTARAASLTRTTPRP